MPAITDKNKYIEFCKLDANRKLIPIFSLPIWFDATAENWDVALITDDERIIAALPYCWKGKYITKRIYLPDLNFYQSILFFKTVTNKNEIALQLFNELPKTVRAYFKFLPEHHDIDISSLNFQKENYTTYIINPSQYNGINSTNHKRNINKGIKHQYTIQESQNIALSYSILTSTFKRQNIKSKITLASFQKIIEVVNNHKIGRVLICLDKNKTILASIFVVEDDSSVYYLMGGYAQDYKTTGAMTFLINDVIQSTLQQHKEFNFCGSTKKTIASFFEGFGAQKSILPIWSKKII